MKVISITFSLVVAFEFHAIEENPIPKVE